MICVQIGIKSAKTNDGTRRDIDPRGKARNRIGLRTLFAAALVTAFALGSVTAEPKKPGLPYVTIDHPQFISASQATFLSPQDVLIGVTDGKTAKAYPAAILAQHGVVQDQMADGPIAVTW
jgi:hypothetical protein